MAYASRSGRAFTSPTSPRAFAVCDRCGIWTQHHKLRNQVEWRGASLLPTYIFVCPLCWDRPQEQLRAIVVPADPLPIIQPRVEQFLADETAYMALTGSTTDPVTGLPIPATTTMTTIGGSPMTAEPYGRPAHMDQRAVMPVEGGVSYGDELPLLSVTSNGIDQITVTCSSAHGLSTDDQISAEGLTEARACGFFTITAITATAFTYQTYAENIVPAGSLLASTSRMITCLVGLPLGYDQIQQVGP